MRPLLATLLLAACGTDPVAPPGPVASLEIEQLPELTGPVGGQLEFPVIVRARDAAGTLVPGADVEFEMDIAGARLATPAVATDGIGRAGTLVRLAPKPGPQRLTVRSSGAEPVSVTFTATTGTALAVAGDGHHLCAVGADGGIRCWRSRLRAPSNLVPHQWVVDPGRTFTEVANAGRQWCAIDMAGAVACWEAPAAGVAIVASTPVVGAPPLRGIAGAAVVSPSWCGIASDGRAWCWGSNPHGLTGTGASPPRIETPTSIATDARFTQVSVGGDHYCGLDTEGVVWCWGSNDVMQLGYPDRSERGMPPRPVAAPVAFTSVGAIQGFSATCAAGVDARVYCWGSPRFGLLGRWPAGGSTDPDNWQPIAVPTVTNVMDYRANILGSIVITADGRLTYWGEFCCDGFTDGPLTFTGLGITPTRILPGRPEEIACVDVVGGGTVCLSLNILLAEQVSGIPPTLGFAEAVPEG